jgi:tetratricopeptide (TPR) repeat protein
MRTILVTFVVSLLLFLPLAGCDLIDPSNVENPDITEDAALQNPNPLQSWVTGLERQLSITLSNTTLVVSELATDNYVNTQTFFNQNVDDLVFDFRDDDIDDTFFTFNDLRESAEFGLTDVAEADDNPRPQDLAELDFFRGYGHLGLGEYFHSAPLDGGEAPATSADHFQAAIEAFQAAIDRGAGQTTAYQMGLARAYYNAGDIANATAAAQQVLDADPTFVRMADFDNQNTSGADNNEMQDALYDRGTFDDLQPLPRLDFLDPKYALISASEEAPVAILKAEEAHLILIEAALAQNDLPGAQDEMKELIDLVEQRPLRTTDESIEGRTEDDPGSRPDTTAALVAASPNDDLRAGLVLNRTETTDVPSISGTSVTDAIVDDIDSADEAWEILYLLRQEIFIAEGRRMIDFGIKFPLPENESLANPNVSEGPATQPIVPSFIDGQPLDDFTYDPDTFEAVIDVNMNRVLAQNRTSVSPFLQ